jgi:hypothetical protein
MSVRISNMEASIRRGLRAMEWRRYMAAMWIICGELQSAFADELGGADLLLIMSTRELVRNVARGVVNDGDEGASELAGAWLECCAHEDQVSKGLACFWAVCQYLVGEVTGEIGKNRGTAWLFNVVRDRWRTPEEKMRNAFPIYDPKEEIDDSSPLGKFLNLLQTIVASATDYSGDLDPVLMRATILGK